MTAPKREMLHDIEPNPHPSRAWHAATPPVCPTCGCDHSYPVWADRDAIRSLYAERDRALAMVARLRDVAEAAYEYIYHPENIPDDPLFHKAEWLRTQLDHLQPGDLDEVQP